jgi:hypothetical protein
MATLVERLKQAITGSNESSNIAQVFRIAPLSIQEREKVSEILDQHRQDEKEIVTDLKMLSEITAEIKAITCQAAILHGERIKKAQEILKSYRDGAFTAWLIATYGNRQTPYNFLQYYELYRAIPKALAPKLDEMPRQIAYALASRSGSLDQKLQIIQNYSGQSKVEMLQAIRSAFPLSLQDKRAHDPVRVTIDALRKIEMQMKHESFVPTEGQKKALKEVFRNLQKALS